MCIFMKTTFGLSRKLLTYSDVSVYIFIHADTAFNHTFTVVAKINSNLLIERGQEKYF